MQRSSDKVILFPKWKQTLEQESLHALEQKEYKKALQKLNQLLAYDYQKNEIVMGKIICLMELHQYDEAQELCESLLKHKSAYHDAEDYYHYLHMYLTILFQTNQYQMLMEQVEYALADESVPIEMTTMFQQLYELSKGMQYENNVQQFDQLVQELTEAVNNNDYGKQWRLIENIKPLKIAPPKEIYTYLMNNEIHPVIKTNLFQWLQQSGVEELVDIKKENSYLSINPTAIPPIKKHTIMKKMTLLLSDQEQKDPTLYHLMEKQLYRYLYVWYPILPDESELESLAVALSLLGENYLRGEPPEQATQSDGTVESYIHDIQLCETLYVSILDDSF